MKIEVEREVLYQLACMAGGGRVEGGRSVVLLQKVNQAARRIAEAAAIPENGPIEFVVN